MPDWRNLQPARWLRKVGHRGPVRVTIGDPPRRAAVILDGVDATDAIRGFQLVQEPGEFPILLLELPIHPAEGQTSTVDCAATEVLIPEATAQLLTRAGWIPPADDDATSDGQADGEPGEASAELVAWLTAQLDQDERTARAAAKLSDGHGWGTCPDGCCVVLKIPEGERRPGAYGRVVAESACRHTEHIVRHDPAAVLAHVAALRTVVAALAGDLTGDDQAGLGRLRAQWALRVLASAYADRPGYREVWRGDDA